MHVLVHALLLSVLHARAQGSGSAGSSTCSTPGALPTESDSLLQHSGALSTLSTPLVERTEQGTLLDDAPQARDGTLLRRLTEYMSMGNFEVPGDDALQVVVAAHPGCDVTWLALQPHKALVVSDISANGRVKYYGYEAGAYISFILQHYDSLPQKMAFVHCHREAWEINDEAAILQSLDPHSYDFAPLTKKWAVDLPDPDMNPTRVHMREIFGHKVPFTGGFPTGRFNFSFAAGAAFLVDRERVLKRGREMWQKIYDWLQLDEDSDVAKRKAMSLEFTWHMLLGEPAEMLPPDPGRLCPSDPKVCAHQPFLDATHVDVPSWRLEWYWHHTKGHAKPARDSSAGVRAPPRKA